MRLESQTLTNALEGKPLPDYGKSTYKMTAKDWKKIETDLAEFKDLMKQL